MTDPQPRIFTPHDAGYPVALHADLGAQAPQQLSIWGDSTILQRPLLSLFCSVACPGDVILALYDLAINLRDAGVPVISGFASPMERECEHFLRRGQQPLIQVLARSGERLRISHDVQERLDAGRLVLISPFSGTPRRLTKSTAWTRNICAAALSSAVLIAHASLHGETARLAALVQTWHTPILTLQSTENADLIAHGAHVVTPTDIASWWPLTP